ncbi:MAG TPA: M28 family peptidase [Terriglobales bacterium]|nr:M28 family peptidase [Terriglobales bacterium]
MRRSFFAVLLLFVLSPLALAQKEPSRTAAKDGRVAARLPRAALAAMESISAERMRAHVKFLADDLLEGRGTGARGGDLAALYIATQFELDGLQPAGDHGTWFQKVPLVGITTQPESTFTLLPDQGPPMPLKLGDDYVTTDERQEAVGDIDAPIVFVGYGIRAPEYKWNDFKDADLKGKVLLMLVSEPPSDDPAFFKGKALTYYGRWTYKYEEAARRGALGVILIHKTEMASYGWEVVRNSWSGEKSYLRGGDEPHLRAAGWVQLAVARRLLAASGLDLDQLLQQANSRDFQPIPLRARLAAHLVSRIRTFESSNVVGLLPGSDPARKDQALMYTAHYDHLGIGPAVDGDRIYNGADDNATGCAILLELARAYASAAERPPRSILFASVTAEEQGLLGSQYLGQHPPLPAARLALDLNFDDVQPLGEPEEVEVVGAERTTFYPVVEHTARTFRLEIVPDSNPSAGYYYRSDHFSLARVGVPAFSLNEGDKFQGHPREWGDQQHKQFTAKHYHQPSDEYRPEMDFTADAALARFGFALGWKAASLPGLIQWQPGDEFEAARKASQASAGGRP